MKTWKFLLCSAVAVAAIACDENEIGSSIIDDSTHIVVDSAFTVTGSSEADGKLLSRTVSQLLGVIDSPEYGTLSSDFVSEFMPVSSIDTTGVTVNDIDSLRLELLVQMGNWVGDTITPMRVNVYRLNKNLPYPIHSDFDPTGYYSKSDLLGSASYTVSMLNQKDSLYYEDASTRLKHYYREIDVKLPLELGREFFQKYKTNPELYQNPEAFANYFPGIYATTSFGRGRVVQIGGTVLNMFYRKHETLESGSDTTYYLNGSYFGTTPEIVTNNNIRLRSAESLVARVESGEAILQSPGGYNVGMKFPVKDIMNRLNTLKEESSVVLNSVNVSFPVSKIANANGIDIPKYVLFIRASQKDEFFSKIKLPDSVDSFYASYDSTTGTYSFAMRALFKKFLDEGKEPTDDDEDWMLIPVDAGFESSSSSSSYYYSYYYGSTTSSTLISMTPQISLPSMGKIDLENAKIILTCSKKDFN